MDKKLSKEKTEQVRHHLEKCITCQDEVDGLVILFDEMNKVENEQPDESLKQDFMAMLDAEKQKTGSSSSKKKGRKVWLQSPLSQAAAGIAILIAGIHPIIPILGFDSAMSEMVVWVTRAYLLGIVGLSIQELFARAFTLNKMLVSL